MFFDTHWYMSFTIPIEKVSLHHCSRCKSFLGLVFIIHKSKFSDSPFFNNISSSLVITDYCFWQRKGSIWRLGWVFTNLEQGQNRLADLLTHFRPCINTRRYLHTFPNFALLDNRAIYVQSKDLEEVHWTESTGKYLNRNLERRRKKFK